MAHAGKLLFYLYARAGNRLVLTEFCCDPNIRETKKPSW